jgi:PAS domain S-box-containing protein
MRLMNLSSSVGSGWAEGLTVLSQDDERVLCRGWRHDDDGQRTAVLAVLSASEPPTTSFVDRLAHEYGLRNELDGQWAARPLALIREHGRTALVLEDAGGEPLDRFIGQPMETGRFLRFAVGLTAAVGELHRRGLVHKDIKPAHAVVDPETGRAWLTGFGITSRLPRERQSPESPELIAGTLAYMAPEQTGRMNRSIDSRSDLYSLGVSFYEMLTGALPFRASDPMEWIHCHIARAHVPAAERLKDLPGTISGIISKLLAKTAEDRYQTAAGIESDLRRCLAQWERERHVEDFSLGEHDTSDRLLVPERLYGRAREINALLAAFDRVVAKGAPELVLVSGYSGIGKSSVVNELHKALVPSRGLFAAGKFDQYKCDIPYATLAQAFQSLVHRLLGESDAELQSWRDRLRQALDPNGSLILNLVPELKLIIGPQPAVPDLPPQDAQNRFQLVFQRFIGVFARPEHPLVLFLDDLQWLDTATLGLLRQLSTAPEVSHLLIVGAYRDNEVSPSHPLVRTLDGIRKTGGRVQEIVLPPLELEDVTLLVGDAIRSEHERVRPLAQLVQEKTGGNPFFAIQFFTAMAEEGLLAFDQITRAWHWDMGRIRGKTYTDNVVDLVAGKLRRLSSTAQESLKLLACLGDAAPTASLALVHATTQEAVHARLWEAVRAGLVFREDSTYKFLHDRIQQAAYSLIPNKQRADVHLRIARALLAGMSTDELTERLFDVADQFNRGAARLSDADEKARVAGIELRAGRRAKASTAYASACVFLATGLTLIGSDGLDDPNRYALAFALSLERAECELLSGNFSEAEPLIARLIAGAASRVDKAAAYSLQIDLHLIRSQKPEGVAAGLECLRLFGIDMPAHPTQEEVQSEYEMVWTNLRGRSIESLLDLPLMTDPETRAAMRVLAFLTGPALYTDINLYHLHFCKMVNLSLQHGISDASTFGYAGLGVILCQPFRHYAEGYRFAKLACDLVEKHGFAAYKTKTCLAAEMVALWTHPIDFGIRLVRAGLQAGAETGDLSFASFCCMHLVTNLLIQGVHLDEVWREAEVCLDFVRRAKYLDAADAIISQRQFIRNLRGETARFSSFSDETFDETRFEARLTEDRMTPMVSRYWILKIQARFMSGDYAQALDAAQQAKRVHFSSEAFLHSLDYNYYAALTIAACCENASAEEQQELRELLTAHEEQLRVWAETYPPTFADKHALVGAEIARIEGRDGDAMRLYESAIRSARENDFVQNAGLAYEVAARFYSARGFESIATAYLRNARQCFLRWGAHGKVKQLDRLYPHLAAGEGVGPTAPSGSPLQQLDLAAVLKASQAVSSEIVLPKLIERLMTIALENAGADRGLLISPVQNNYSIEAEGRATGAHIEVVPRQQSTDGGAFPESLVRYVIRTHERVILDDASRPNRFSEDEYFRGHQVKSILCLPLIKLGQLTAVLYLENTLTSRAFPPDRINILELLASQAAISLENSRLYGDLQQREAKIRRLVDANIMGIFIWDFDGRILDANDAFLHMVNYDREDLVAGRIRWAELTPPDWRDRNNARIATHKGSGHFPPYEKEYTRKDGTRVPVLMGGATFEQGGSQGMAYVVDLTERKRAEEALREGERRYREAQMELAHANRLATMGQLTASIAHEVNQPITGVVTNAHAALRFLDAEPADLDEVRQILNDIVKGGNRAGDVIGRIRDLIKKAPPRNDPLDINEVVGEIAELARGETLSNGVSVRIGLENHLPRIRGDRVQLQQVVLNLIVNAVEAMAETREDSRKLLITSGKGELGGVVVAVRDTGPGLPPGATEHLFEPFHTTKPNGMGMGLSICRSIVEAHGGRLWASANVPRGAVFEFTLPADDDQAC